MEVLNGRYKAGNRIVYAFFFSIATHAVVFLCISNHEVADKKREDLKIRNIWKVIYLSEKYVNQENKIAGKSQRKVSTTNKEAVKSIFNGRRLPVDFFSKTDGVHDKKINGPRYHYPAEMPVSLGRDFILSDIDESKYWPIDNRIQTDDFALNSTLNELVVKRGAVSLGNSIFTIPDFDQRALRSIENIKKIDDLSLNSVVSEPVIKNRLSSYQTIFGEYLIQKGEVCFTVKENPINKNKKIWSLPKKCVGTKDSSEKMAIKLKNMMKKYKRQQQ